MKKSEFFTFQASHQRWSQAQPEAQPQPQLQPQPQPVAQLHRQVWYFFSLLNP